MLEAASVSWGRGFFRAWLILSAIWIGLAVYIAKPLTYSWLWKAPKYEITTVKGNKITLDSAQSHNDLVAALTEFMKRDGVDLSERDQILMGINSRYGRAGRAGVAGYFYSATRVVGSGFGFDLGLSGFSCSRRPLLTA
jgi:hypothetical protein